MKKIVSAIVVFLFFVQVSGQEKPALDYSVYDQWKSLSAQTISHDGQWVSYEINPAVGDGLLYLNHQVDQKIFSFERGDGARLSGNNDFMAFKIKPFADSVRQEKLNKVKKDKMSKDSLALYGFSDGNLRKWAGLKSFKIQEYGPSVLAFMLEEADSVSKQDVDKDKEKEAEKEPEKKAKKKDKKKEFKGAKLTVLFPDDGQEMVFENVTDYNFVKESAALLITSILEDSVNTSAVDILYTDKREVKRIWEKEGVTKGVTVPEKLDQLVFLHSEDTTKTRVYSLYHWTAKKGKIDMLVDTLTAGMRDGWAVAENGRLRFSDDGSLLFLGTKEKPEVEKEEKDTLLKEERVYLDIWSWDEDVLQSRQLKQVGREKNKSYQAFVDLKKNAFVQLGDPEGIESYLFPKFGQAETALALDDNPYAWSNDVAYESFKDVYLYDLKSKQNRLIFKEVEFRPSLSPTGKFLYWWEPQDSNHYIYNIEKDQVVCLTVGLPVSFAVDNNDYPNDTGNWGTMGWTKDDESLYIYDKYDIWKFDPLMKSDPVCVTQGFGRDKQLTLRYRKVDRDQDYLDESKAYYFDAFNHENKKSGYYRMTLQGGNPTQLIFGDFKIRILAKAKDSDELIWTRSTVTDYPELHISDTDFSGINKLTETNPQQKDYNWLTVELVEWLDYDGVRHQGLLYKPENFDPQKKYPMMVYFYRLHSDGLHNHITPRASYSTINTAFYASNGYLVFMPDVYFKIGHPGRSAFNSVVSGVMALGKGRTYIDMEHLGIQGQSWGGYQAAYIITQTDLFAAASPGAPVSNMTSAYGGIRLGSGMVRQFQYEKTQSRIGGTLWDKPVEFYENSPLFYANQCNTPCLIRHNDHDDAVPFSQGVEFFTALRRLGKPAWLLNYNNGPHNLTKKLSNRKDLSVRMKQFFDHYLKDAPAPEWLSEGVQAVDKKNSETYYLQYVK